MFRSSFGEERLFAITRLVLRSVDGADPVSSGCVCFCDRSAYVLAAHFPKLDAIPSVHADFGPYLAFDLNYSAIWAITTELYYFILAPGVTVSHTTIAGRNNTSLTTRDMWLPRFDRSLFF